MAEIYSKYVVNNNNKLFCTVQKISLPLNSTNEELHKHRMLAGDEQKAIDHKLFSPTETGKISIIPTWGCNLRCAHCCVIDKLKKTSDSALDVDNTIGFINRYKAKHNKKLIGIYFVGGEPTLRLDIIKSFIEKLNDCKFNITTNLTTDVDNHVPLLSKLDHISISVDGLPHNFNKQRIPLVKADDLFGKVIYNIKYLVMAGLRDKMSIQATVPDFEMHNKHAFIHFFANLGIAQNKISYGVEHPHRRKPNGSDLFQESLKDQPLIGNQCCRYQPGSQFVIEPDNNIVSDFYKRDVLGTIYDDPDTIINNHIELVKKSMPAYNDPVCKKCDVIGYCWGFCSASIPFTGDSPSSKCDPGRLRSKIISAASNGELIDEKSYC